jgi:hypothetical protein
MCLPAFKIFLNCSIFLSCMVLVSFQNFLSPFKFFHNKFKFSLLLFLWGLLFGYIRSHKSSIKLWGGGNFEIESKNNPPYEANYLKLDCSKSIKRLDWTPKLSIEQSISMTCAWYKNFYENNLDMYRFSVDQINQFELI